MICDWLLPDDSYTLLDAVCTRTPHAGAGSAECDVSLLRWETLDRVLASEQPVDVLTLAGGRLVEAVVPRSAKAVQRLLHCGQGVSTVIRASEAHDAGLAALAASFSELFSGEVHIQIYATPAGAHSYGWRYDFEDVFILQTLGVKEFLYRDNTVARHTRLGDTVDFSLIGNETSQLKTARLHAGDWLYIPRRFWHLVTGVEDSLSISIGVMPLDELRHARRRGGRGSAGTGIGSS